MPLDPKQQPPYYTPGTTPTPPTSGSYTELNTQFNAVQTSGTTETDLYLYTLPPNTLTQNNDRLLITFNYLLSVSGANNILRFYIGGVNQFTHTTDADPTAVKIQIELIRTSSTTLRMAMTTINGGLAFYVTQQFQDANTLDFTNTIPIKFTGDCDNPGQIQTYSLTIDKISS